MSQADQHEESSAAEPNTEVPEISTAPEQEGSTENDASKEVQSDDKDRVETVANGTDSKSSPAPEADEAPKKTRKNNSQNSGAKGDEDASDNGFKAGDSVQVKIQGYPWWPALIVTEDHFTAAALAARPAVKIRKDGTSTVFYPVQFLGSPEYYWSRPTDIKHLSLDEIKAWINSGKKSTSKGLKAAYQEASTQPTLDDLMQSKLQIEGAIPDEDDEMPDEDEAEAAAEDPDSEDIELDDEGKPVKKSKSKKKASRTPKKAPSKTPSKTPTKKRKTDDAENAPAPSAKKTKTPRGTARARQISPPASPELSPEETAKLQYDQKVKSVMFVRHKLQKCLLGPVCEVKLLPDVPGFLEKLDNVDVDIQLFRDTKIGKVLVRINKLDQIPQDEDLKIKKHVGQLLEKWQETMDLQKKKDEEDAQSRAAPQSPLAEPEIKNDAKSEDDAKETPTNGHTDEPATTNGESEKTATTTEQEAPVTEEPKSE